MAKKDDRGKNSDNDLATDIPNQGPTWVFTPPGPPEVSPPVVPRPQELPFGELSWENFERLCMRLASRVGEPERWQLYGEPGQSQDGIDILVRLRSGQYNVWQSKRHKTFSAAKINDAVEEFLNGKWREKTSKIILVVQARLRDTKIANEIELQTDRLRKLGIEFEPLGGDELSERLKIEPDLIEEFFGPAWAELFCGAGSSSHLKAQETSTVVTRYCTWLAESTRHYLIPGIGVQIPIATCWIDLEAYELPIEKAPPQTAKEALDFYLRTYSSDSSKGKSYDAEWLGVGLRRIVILGGPGTGKSLLLRRIAHCEAKCDRTVLLARLRFVAASISQSGKSFEESLLEVATEGSRFNNAQKRIVLENASLILLDGLDECGSNRNAIATEVTKWSAGHPNITVIVTSRSVGHSPGALPDWPHFQIRARDYPLSLYEFAIEGVCREVFKDQDELVEDVENRLDAIINASSWRSEDKEYELIRSVPLLFGFMVSLAVNGCDIPKTRNELYAAVIHLLARSEVQDRGIETNVDTTVAYCGLYFFAWLLMQNPVRDLSDLLDETGQLLADETGEKPMAGRRLAEKVFRFWEERRLLERVRHGFQEIATFIHLGFCEYAAAKFLMDFGRIDVASWVSETRGDTRWREVYQYAALLGMAQTLVQFLLDLDEPSGKNSEDLILAANLSTASETVSDGLVAELLDHLLPSFTSGFREIILRAGAAVLPLAGRAPQVVGPYAKPLLVHENEWTRCAALALCLEAGGEYVDLEDLQHRYPDLLPKRRSRSPFGGITFDLDDYWLNLKSTTIVRATSILLARGLTPNLRDNIRTLFDKIELSLTDTDKLIRLLRDSEDAKLVEIADQQHSKFLDRWLQPHAWTNDDQVEFLDFVLQACAVTESKEEPGERPFINFAKFKQVLGLGEMQAGSLRTCRHSLGKDEAAILAFRGAMLAAGVEPADLARDILGIKEELENEQGSFFTLSPDFPYDGEWEKSKLIPELNARVLASAVGHPCKAVAIVAIEMILAGTGGQHVSEALKEVLREGGSYALFILGQVGETLWGASTLDLFLKRLERKISPGCEYLLAKLPDLSAGKVDDRILSVIKRALTSKSAIVATQTAELCFKFTSTGPISPELRGALVYWEKNEEPYPKRGGVVPRSPRAILVKLLAKRQELKTDELLELCLDVRSDVRNAAKEALLDLAQTDAEILTQLLNGIEAGKFGSEMLYRITKLPSEVLKHERNRLLGFLESENPDVRIVMVQGLRGMCLVAEEETLELTRKMLDDSDVEVCDSARRVLSSLEKQSI